MVWNAGSSHGQSGDRGCWFDFSAYTTVGTYYINDPTTGEKSAPFEINANPYADVLKAVLKMFYYNRCNDNKQQPFAAAVWTDATNFMNPLQDVHCRYVGSSDGHFFLNTYDQYSGRAEMGTGLADENEQCGWIGTHQDGQHRLDNTSVASTIRNSAVYYSI